MHGLTTYNLVWEVLEDNLTDGFLCREHPRRQENNSSWWWVTVHHLKGWHVLYYHYHPTFLLIIRGLIKHWILRSCKILPPHPSSHFPTMSIKLTINMNMLSPRSLKICMLSFLTGSWTCRWWGGAGSSPICPDLPQIPPPRSPSKKSLHQVIPLPSSITYSPLNQDPPESLFWTVDNDGDHDQLRHLGDVPALRRFRILWQKMPDTEGDAEKLKIENHLKNEIFLRQQ